MIAVGSGHRPRCQTSAYVHVLRDELRRTLIPIKDVVDYPEEESTEEKEEELRRSVIRELGHVDRLLREREKLLHDARRVKAKNGGRRGRGTEPPWKKYENQAQSKQRVAFAAPYPGQETRRRLGQQVEKMKRQSEDQIEQIKPSKSASGVNGGAYTTPTAAYEPSSS